VLQPWNWPFRQDLFDLRNKRRPRRVAANELRESTGGALVELAEPNDFGDDRGLSAGLVLPQNQAGRLVGESLWPIELDNPFRKRPDGNGRLAAVVLNTVDQCEQQRWLVRGGESRFIKQREKLFTERERIGHRVLQ
jgi:hypothetical protein